MYSYFNPARSYHTASTSENDCGNDLNMDLFSYSEPVKDTTLFETDKGSDAVVLEKTEEKLTSGDNATGKLGEPKNMDGTNICKFNIGDDKKSKYVTVRHFQGKVYVDIREFYGSDGLHFPTKKGITLTVNNFKSLLSVTKKVNAGIYQAHQRNKKRQ
nr:activated RNA polymerase II transcriptional coactivator p15-like [Lytechinus pictus]